MHAAGLTLQFFGAFQSAYPDFGFIMDELDIPGWYPALIVVVLIIGRKILGVPFWGNSRHSGFREFVSELGLAKLLLVQYFYFCGSLNVEQLRPRSRAAYALRATRVFLYMRPHIELFRLDSYMNCAAPILKHDLFHHLSRRYYLARHLTPRQRVQCRLSHYRFEDESFDLRYRQQVYSSGGLVLWKKTLNGAEFQILLGLADRYAAEGDLGVTLLVDGERLHALFFSWVTGELALRSDRAIFIALNQGRHQHESQEKFNAAFPYNSPNFACYAALQGIAQAVGAKQLLAVSSHLQVCYSPKRSEKFNKSYNSFWEEAGGVRDSSGIYVLPVPRPMKPLSEIPAKHRKRAANRRVLLNEISTHSCRRVALRFHGRKLD